MRTASHLITRLSLISALSWVSASCFAQSPQFQEKKWVAEVAEHGRLGVENASGDVRLRAGGEKGRQIEVFGALQPSESGDIPNVQLLQQSDGKLVIVVQSPVVKQGRPSRADLVIFVPGSVPVEVTTKDGLVEAKGVSGLVQISTERGEIIAKGLKGGLCAKSETGAISAELETGPSLAQLMTTKTGDITAYLWEDASVSIQASTSGEVSTDFSLQMEYRRSEEPSKIALVALGSGASRLSIESKQGRVRMLRLPRGFKKEGPNDAKSE